MMTLEPGSFPWACQMMLEGKTVCRADDSTQYKITGDGGGDPHVRMGFFDWDRPVFFPGDLTATNWEVVDV